MSLGVPIPFQVIAELIIFCNNIPDDFTDQERDVLKITQIWSQECYNKWIENNQYDFMGTYNNKEKLQQFLRDNKDSILKLIPGAVFSGAYDALI